MDKLDLVLRKLDKVLRRFDEIEANEIAQEEYREYGHREIYNMRTGRGHIGGKVDPRLLAAVWTAESVEDALREGPVIGRRIKRHIR